MMQEVETPTKSLNPGESSSSEGVQAALPLTRQVIRAALRKGLQSHPEIAWTGRSSRRKIAREMAASIYSTRNFKLEMTE